MGVGAEAGAGDGGENPEGGFRVYDCFEVATGKEPKGLKVVEDCTVDLGFGVWGGLEIRLTMESFCSWCLASPGFRAEEREVSCSCLFRLFPAGVLVYPPFLSLSKRLTVWKFAFLLPLSPRTRNVGKRSLSRRI